MPGVANKTCAELAEEDLRLKTDKQFKTTTKKCKKRIQDYYCKLFEDAKAYEWCHRYEDSALKIDYMKCLPEVPQTHCKYPVSSIFHA